MSAGRGYIAVDRRRIATSDVAGQLFDRDEITQTTDIESSSLLLRLLRSAS